MSETLELGWPEEVAEALERLRQVFAEAAKSLPTLEQEARALGRWGWTVPMWGTPAELSLTVRHFDHSTVDEYFLGAYGKEKSIQQKALFRELRDHAEVSHWLPLVEQCISAYERKQYLIVVPSLLAVLEGLLAAATKRMQAKVDPKLVTAQQAKLTDAGVTRLGWISVQAFVAEVFRSSHFAESRPFRINRNWVLHGRDVPDWTQADCLRLFQALDTIAVVADFSRALAAAAQHADAGDNGPT